MPRKLRRPTSPRRAAQERVDERAHNADPGQWGVNPHTLALPTGEAIAIAHNRSGQTLRIQRQDIFDRMAGRGALGREALEAVRRMQRDLAILHRTVSGAGEFAPRIDVSRAPHDLNDVRAAAGRRIAEVLGLVGPRGAALIRPLCEIATVTADWRAVIVSVTGERLPDAQGALLRFVCDELAAAYAELDRGRHAQRRLA